MQQIIHQTLRVTFNNIETVNKNDSNWTVDGTL
jgi:hypothetical protein